ncbi:MULTISPECIES: sodium/proline symporter PutP [Bacillaceae]|uniref:Sodium/proline symporter n=1 Tax=Oceanobacillus caeni TaxID=405946 RepID=A0ABR5MFP8_9BACI|nr:MULTISPECIES: sodium/proline symporter PutP [Bacillaceae]KKE80192.1 proline:sodium symporter PutP [Bacilli bacterium VT-13-104]PZD83420.1 sodium/proline symporter PutP [Bacilli bacterium]KPH71179.1 proline:sodium symporter PutP [Oceanobacillus caeni]MED4474554.1 sodium/proline symporter PutP [Oceanobacillus caeni]PZD83704.1 sodium/proline symporter PutP [Bacilli bacterium]
MTDITYQLIAIIIYLAGMVSIGWYAYRRTKDFSDYMLGGRDLGPAVSALSAGAADMSQWLLMGLPGAIYVAGLVEGWIAIGLTIGAWLNWYLVAPRLRVYTQVSNNSITIPSFLDNRFKGNSKLLRIVSGIVILVFFTFYVSSGMVAGGVFFESSFGYSYHTGLIIVALVVIAYTFLGGFLAVSYTDFIQGTIMFFALIIVPIGGLFLNGGIGETLDSIRSVDINLLSFFATASVAGVISSLAWGLGYFGQPHIIVRFMAIKDVKETKSARRIGIGWMILSLVGAAATALIGVAYFQQNPNVTLDNPEAVFIVMGQIIFHPFIAGIMLAAVLAAIMSTVSSQLLVTSSALVEDIFKTLVKKEVSDKTYVNLGRLGVLAVSIIAGIFAWQQNDTILGLVSFAWAGFGASFGPIILLSLYWKKITGTGALAGMIVGAVTAFIWGSTALSGYLYEIVPGFILNLIVAYIVSILTFKPNKEIEDEFDKTLEILNKN